jgi:putative CocE/NonD family hydrolase
MNIKNHHFRIIGLLIVMAFSTVTRAQDLGGEWNGYLSVQGLSLKIVLHVEESEEGLTATFDSPDQSAYGIPIDTIWFKDGNLEFRWSAGGVTYTGTLNQATAEIDGIFNQGGQKFPLVLSREEVEVPKNSMAYIRKHYDKKEVYIPMRDGVKLFTSIYTPKDSDGNHPIMVNRTPYNAEPSEQGYNFFLLIMGDYVEDRYIFVFQDVRGRYMSEGTFVDVRPIIPEKDSDQDIDESTDTYDTMEWLIENVPGNNGRIGIMGTSYPGFYATMALPGAHPALKAVSPQAPIGDWFIGDDFHHNGAFFMLDAFSFYYTFGRPRPEPTRRGNPGFRWPVEDSYEFFMRLGPVKNIVEKYFGDTIAFWNQVVQHPDYDDFWKARTPLPHLKNIAPAVMTVGGWYDAEDLYGPLKTYEAIETQNPQSVNNRLVMGPWSHGQWNMGPAENLGNVFWGMDANAHYRKIEQKFFDYYLLGEGEMDLPEASIFNTGTSEWMAFDHWPPADTEIRALYFHSGGQLSFEKPSRNEGSDAYISDPMKPVPYQEDVHLRRTTQYMTGDQRFAARRPDVLVYSTDILEEDVTITGSMFANLYVSTTGTDADFVVKLIDVFPDLMPGYPENDRDVPMGGYQKLVRGEVMRGRYRNSFEHPEPFTPGEPTLVKFELQDVAHTFKKGHRIMVQVQSSWFPLVDRNPQTFVDIYHCDEDDFQKATHQVFHNARHPSHLEVKVLNK